MSYYLGILWKIDTKTIGFHVAFFSLFLEWVIRSILIYQESYWGWDENLYKFIYSYLIKIPVFSILFSLLSVEIIAGKLGGKSRIVIGLLCLFGINLFILILKHWDNPTLSNISRSNLELLGVYGYYFLIGYFISRREELIDKMRYIIFFGQILLILQIVIFADFSEFSIDLKSLHHNNFIHQFLGNNFLLWSTITLSVLKDKQRLLFFIICIPLLFFLSSRSAFYCFIFLVPLIFYSFNSNKHLIYTILLTCVAISFLFVIFPSMKDHRMFAIFTVHDPSTNTRLDTFFRGFSIILKNWMWGDYGGLNGQINPSKSYIHNFLSFWRQFGLVPFGIIMTLIVLVIIESKNQFYYINESRSFMIISLAIVMISSVTFAHGYKYAMIFLLFGFIGSSQSFRKATNSPELINRRNDF
jgi:hypothetical protein